MLLVYCNCYPFQGAPDIFIRQQPVISSRGHYEDGSTRDEGDCIKDDSSDDKVMECCHQRNPIKGKSNHLPPEKLGELIAACHCLLVTKILKRVQKGSSKVAVESTGLLLDKMVGVARCTVKTSVKVGELFHIYGSCY